VGKEKIWGLKGQKWGRKKNGERKRKWGKKKKGNGRIGEKNKVGKL
jgi:hypothetical protein